MWFIPIIPNEITAKAQANDYVNGIKYPMVVDRPMITPKNQRDKF